MSDPTLQWKRECNVVIGASGKGLLIEDLRVTFEITKTIGRTPNTALVKIYNLNPDHTGQVTGTIGDLTHEDVDMKFDEILVNAGYKGAAQLIFRGNIRNAFSYREDTDYILEIDAADGDKDFRSCVLNFTHAKGASAAQLLDKVVSSFATTKKGHTVIKERKRIRGKVVSGMARDVLDDLAAESDAHWSIQDGQLQIVPVDSTLPTEAIVLRSDTGLLGAPELSNKGIQATCLLNPQLRVNGKVFLDNNALKAKIAKEREKKPGAKPSAKKKVSRELARLDKDGVYKIFKLVHKGDTRGNEWTSEVHCVGLEKAIPPGKAAA